MLERQAMPESFVSADVAAEFLGVNRRFLLSMARDGVSGAYPLGAGKQRRRNKWVFKLSELSSAVRQKRCDPKQGGSR
jgi:hypothetical protein